MDKGGPSQEMLIKISPREHEKESWMLTAGVSFTARINKKRRRQRFFICTDRVYTSFPECTNIISGFCGIYKVTHFSPEFFSQKWSSLNEAPFPVFYTIFFQSGKKGDDGNLEFVYSAQMAWLCLFVGWVVAYVMCVERKV